MNLTLNSIPAWLAEQGIKNPFTGKPPSKHVIRRALHSAQLGSQVYPYHNAPYLVDGEALLAYFRDESVFRGPGNAIRCQYHDGTCKGRRVGGVCEKHRQAHTEEP